MKRSARLVTVRADDVLRCDRHERFGIRTAFQDDDAATVQVIERILSGEVIPVYSGTIMSEYREVLKRRRFGFPGELVNSLLSAIEMCGILTAPAPSGAVLPDMKDLPFYEVVMEKRDDDAYLVTGNTKHFPKEPFVVTAREFLDILDKKNEE